METFYKILGLQPDATLKEIQNAYAEAASNTYPIYPLTKNTIEKFLKIQSAYDTLSDIRKRNEYDLAIIFNNKEKLETFCYVITTFTSSLDYIYQQLPHFLKLYEKKLSETKDAVLLYHMYSFIRVIFLQVEGVAINRLISDIKNSKNFDADLKLFNVNSGKLRNLEHKFRDKFIEMTLEKNKKLIQNIKQIIQNTLSPQVKELQIIMNKDYSQLNNKDITHTVRVYIELYLNISGKLLLKIDVIPEYPEYVTVIKKAVSDSNEAPSLTLLAVEDDSKNPYSLIYDININFYKKNTLLKTTKNSKDEVDDEIARGENATAQNTSTSTSIDRIQSPSDEISDVAPTPDSKQKSNNEYQIIWKKITEKILNCEFKLHGGIGKKINGATYGNAAIGYKSISTGAYKTLTIAYQLSQQADITEDAMQHATYYIRAELKEKRKTHSGFFGLGGRDQKTVDLYKDILQELNSFYQDTVHDSSFTP